MIIDSHMHVWDANPKVYPWLTSELAPIDREWGMADVRPELVASGVGAAVLVQAADADTDTEAMLAIAAESPEIVAVVGWVPLNDPKRTASRLEYLRQHPLFVGMRALIHDYTDPEWILRPDVAAGLRLVEEAEFTFDVVTASPAALELVPRLSKRHPNLRIVIDHLGKPPIGGTPDEHAAWRELLAAAAENPNVRAKVSGLFSRLSSPDSWTTDVLRPVVLDALEIFGPDRLMYGGDWPMCVLTGGYARAWAALEELLEELAPAERNRVLAGTAQEFYRIDSALMSRTLAAH